MTEKELMIEYLRELMGSKQYYTINMLFWIRLEPNTILVEVGKMDDTGVFVIFKSNDNKDYTMWTKYTWDEFWNLFAWIKYLDGRYITKQNIHDRIIKANKDVTEFYHWSSNANFINRLKKRKEEREMKNNLQKTTHEELLKLYLKELADITKIHKVLIKFYYPNGEPITEEFDLRKPVKDTVKKSEILTTDAEGVIKKVTISIFDFQKVLDDLCVEFIREQCLQAHNWDTREGGVYVIYDVPVKNGYLTLDHTEGLSSCSIVYGSKSNALENTRLENVWKTLRTITDSNGKTYSKPDIINDSLKKMNYSGVQTWYDYLLETQQIIDGSPKSDPKGVL